MCVASGGGSRRAGVSLVTLSHPRASLSYPVLSFSEEAKCSILSSEYVLCIKTVSEGLL